MAMPWVKVESPKVHIERFCVEPSQLWASNFGTVIPDAEQCASEKTKFQLRRTIPSLSMQTHECIIRYLQNSAECEMFALFLQRFIPSVVLAL